MPLRKIILFFFCCAAAFGIQAQCYQTFLDEGKAYARQGKWDKAIASYKDAKQCQSDKPANGDSVLNGLINEAQKQKKAAIDRQKAKNEQQKRKKATAPKVPLPDMVAITSGTFDMGSNDGESDEKPVHQVRVKEFYLSRHELTNAEFCAFLNEKGNQKEGGVEWINLGGSYQDEKCRLQKSGSQYKVESGYERYPVIYVSWYGAKAYCQWLADRTGEPYRLPTEAEWEYVAGGGSNKRSKWAGTNESSQIYRYANFCDSKCKESWADKNQTDGYIHTAPVGYFWSNALTIKDMSGNVWEWCADTWHDSYTGAPADGTVCIDGGDQSRAVLRGGSWENNDFGCRAADRNWGNRNVRVSNVGLRVAKGGGAD